MTRLTLEIENSRDLALLNAFLKLLNVKVLRQEKAQQSATIKLADFYKSINVDLKNFKFNRDEANER